MTHFSNHKCTKVCSVISFQTGLVDVLLINTISHPCTLESVDKVTPAILSQGVWVYNDICKCYHCKYIPKSASPGDKQASWWNPKLSTFMNVYELGETPSSSSCQQEHWLPVAFTVFLQCTLKVRRLLVSIFFLLYFTVRLTIVATTLQNVLPHEKHFAEFCLSVLHHENDSLVRDY